MEKFWENPKFQMQVINDDDLCERCRKRPRIKSEHRDDDNQSSLCSTCQGADVTWENRYKDGMRVREQKGKKGNGEKGKK